MAMPKKKSLARKKQTTKRTYSSKKKLQKTQFKFPFKSLIVTEILAIILLSFGTLAINFPNLIPAIQRTWTLATTVQPETFTELYFENHTNLPGTIERNKTYTFSFTLHNLEYKDMNYPYEVYLDINGEKQYLDNGSVFLKNNEYKTIQEDFTISLPISRIKVVANLINKDQSIDFWITEKQSTQSVVISSKDKKMYGGWYWRYDLNKAQVWLGKDCSGNDVWAEELPAKRPITCITNVQVYGGWYWQQNLNRAQIWLGKDCSGSDVWADELPKKNIPTCIRWKVYGGWYWRPELNKAQVWFGKNKAGEDIWADEFPKKKTKK